MPTSSPLSPSTSAFTAALWPKWPSGPYRLPDPPQRLWRHGLFDDLADGGEVNTWIQHRRESGFGTDPKVTKDAFGFIPSGSQQCPSGALCGRSLPQPAFPPVQVTSTDWAFARRPELFARISLCRLSNFLAQIRCEIITSRCHLSQLRISGQRFSGLLHSSTGGCRIRQPESWNPEDQAADL
jgi:hypothetical protein